MFSISTPAPSFGSSTPAHRFPRHRQLPEAGSSSAHKMAGSIASAEAPIANHSSGGKPTFLTLETFRVLGDFQLERLSGSITSVSIDKLWVRKVGLPPAVLVCIPT